MWVVLRSLVVSVSGLNFNGLVRRDIPIIEICDGSCGPFFYQKTKAMTVNLWVFGSIVNFRSKRWLKLQLEVKKETNDNFKSELFCENYTPQLILNLNFCPTCTNTRITLSSNNNIYMYLFIYLSVFLFYHFSSNSLLWSQIIR